MAREVEHRNVAHATVQPYQGADPEALLPDVPRAERYNRRDWTELRPPASSRMQETWAKVIQPYRASLLARLWLTYAWWRPVVTLAVLATLAMLLLIATGCGLSTPRVESGDAHARQACAQLDEADVIRTSATDQAEAELQAMTAEVKAGTYAAQSEVPELNAAADHDERADVVRAIREWCEVNR